MSALAMKIPLFERHLVSRKAKKGKAKRMIVAGLMLTSMVDMFSLLVIFLLQSFSSQPTTINISEKLILPTAATSAPAEDALVLTITREEITLDQVLIGSPESVLKDPEALVKILDEQKTVWMAKHPNENFVGQINFQADQSLPSTLISHIMSVVQSQGYQSLQLAVVSGAP